jgi:hypothetical protein
LTTTSTRRPPSSGANRRSVARYTPAADAWPLPSSSKSASAHADQAEQVEKTAEAEDDRLRETVRSAEGVHELRERAEPEHEVLQRSDEDAQHGEDHPDLKEEPGVAAVDPGGGRPERAPRPLPPKLGRRARPPPRACREPQQQGEGDQDDGEARRGMRRDEDERRRCSTNRGAEELRRRGPERASSGEREALRAPGPVRPRERLRPLVLRSAPSTRRRTPAPLAPAALESEPRKRRHRGLGAFRDHLHLRPELAPGLVRVVAPEALGRAAPEEERPGEVVRVQALGRINDRVRPAGELELRRVPFRALGAYVLAVADLERGGAQRSGRRGSVEVELDQLPVAFVQVVEVVVDVEEPVLGGRGAPTRSPRGQRRSGGTGL